MRLEWLEDILAILDEGSLSKAAKQRFLTQSAFTRRIRLIEETVGAPLLDRSRKPVELRPGVQELEQEMRDLAFSLKLLRGELMRQGQKQAGKVTIACAHALTTTVAPVLTKSLHDEFGVTTRVIATSREECDLMLMTRRVDYALVYRSANEGETENPHLIEQVELATDPFVPVADTEYLKQRQQGDEKKEWPIIAYPGKVFVGKTLETDILPHVSPDLSLHRVAETELTHAALEFCRTGMGVAWLPLSLCTAGLRNGELSDLRDLLPMVDLRITAQRLNRSDSEQDPGIWELITGFAYGLPQLAS